ncbi:MAG TPA: hypothetical protein VE266_06425, partial [Steroidobacteraceae bacterium]|nr:hypothetical protein [Steroidobacteraceae bacterium]
HIMATKAIPEGYRTATPYLIVNGAANAIEFYHRAFGATEMLRMARSALAACARMYLPHMQ